MAKRLVIATAAMGIEALVAKEVRALGYECTVEDGKVYIDCEMEDIPRLNMWLRTADRIKLVVAEFFSLEKMAAKEDKGKKKVPENQRCFTC